MAVRRAGVPYDEVNPSSWYGAVVRAGPAGRARGGGGGGVDRKACARAALRERYGIELPEKMPGPSGRPIRTPHDVVDAICIALYGAAQVTAPPPRAVEPLATPPAAEDEEADAPPP